MAKTTKSPTKKTQLPPKKVEAAVSKPEVLSARYSNKNLIISPRKLRLLVNKIKSLRPVDALTQLKFTNTKAARIMVRSLQNVISDAKNNFALKVDTLKFESMKVDEGLKIKRMDKSHGARFARGVIQRRHSRLEIIVKGEK